MPDFVKENSLTEAELALQAAKEMEGNVSGKPERKTLREQLEEAEGMLLGSPSYIQDSLIQH